VTIARNTVLNLTGLAAPLFAALFLVPALVARLDAGRFGFLSLAWILVGYFSLFDLGLGRALARLMAERSAAAHAAELPALSRTALALTFALGAAAGALLFAAAGPVCTRLLNLPADLQSEAVTALRILALCLPFVTLTAALRGLLEGGQRFGWVNAIRIPLGILTFAAPLAAAIAAPGLVALALSLALVRLVALLAHWVVCTRLYPGLTAIGAPAPGAVSGMLSFGAWLSVSNVVGPVLVFLDRFVIGAMLAVSAVAYYSAPYEVITRLWLVPAALAGVLFPAFAASDRALLLARYRTGVKAVLAVIFPLALGGALFAAQWLEAWLGAEYAHQGARAAQLLCIGVLLNCLAYLPFTLLQARGRADLVAKTHLAELPLYFVLLAVTVPALGISGAALAWALRCAGDTAALVWLAHRRILPGETVLSAPQSAVILLALGAVAGALWPWTFEARCAYGAAMACIFAPLIWLVLFDGDDRALARNPLAWLRRAPGA
jgi:O-antigen/teichoic acid export membrane protein